MTTSIRRLKGRRKGEGKKVKRKKKKGEWARRKGWGKVRGQEESREGREKGR